MTKFGSVVLLLTAVAITCCNCLRAKSNANPVSTCPKLSIYKGLIRYKKASGIARIKCASTHTLIGHNYIYCSNHKWVGEIPRCVAKNPQCNRIDENNYPNGKVFLHNNYNRAVASFLCHRHYELRGPETIYCLGSKWDANLPICVSSGNDSTPTSCSFDTDLCGWTQDINHDFDWQRVDGKTTKEGHIWTGPTKDHTQNSSNGYFMYFNSWDDLVGDAARLYSPLYGPDNNFTAFEFYFYHVGGSQLNVYIKNEKVTDVDKIKPVFSSLENTHGGTHTWTHALIDLRNQNSNFQIVIEGVRGDGILNDIAIDDVAFLKSDSETEEPNEETTTSDDSLVFEDDLSCKTRCSENGPRRFLACQCWPGCFNSNNCCPDVLSVCVDHADDFVSISPTDAITFVDTTSTTNTTPRRTTSTTQRTTSTTQRTSSTKQRTTFTTRRTTTSTTQRTPPTTQTTTSTTIRTRPTSTTRKTTTPKFIETADADLDFEDSVPNLGDFDSEETNVIVGQVSSDHETNNTVPFAIISIGVATVVVAIAATVFYSVRKDRNDRNWNQSTNDVRYLTSDEILDFTLATPDNKDSEMLIQEEGIEL